MSLSDATKPLQIISRLVGMNPKSHWHKIYTVFILVFEFTMLYYCWQFYSRTGFADFYFNKLLHVLEDVCRVISLLNILGTGLFDQKRFLVPLEVFARIDQGLKNVNGFIDNRGTHRFHILLGIYFGLILSIFGSLEIFVDLLPAIYSYDEVELIMAIDHFYYRLYVIICAVMDCSFLSTLFIMRKRFKEINLIINCAKKHGSHLAVDFLETSSYIRLIGFGMGDSTLAAESILCALFHVTRILLLVRASESTVAEAKATSLVLQELEMTGDNDRATKSQIREFFTQLQFEGVKFTAWGFFDMDYSLISGVLAAVCTYLVILIQMDNSNAFVMAHFFNESIFNSTK